MPNINTILRQEIARISRKETRALVTSIKSASAAHRRSIAALKRQIAEQQRAIAQLRKGGARSASSEAAATDESPVRFRAGGVASHRKRLGLSAEHFGQLVGVTGQTVYNWEKGKRPRPAQVRALAAIRTIGRREALARLEAMAPEPKRGAKRAAKRRTATKKK